MAQTIAKQDETYLLAVVIPGDHTCAGPECQRKDPGPVRVFWWSEDPAVLPPGGLGYYCSLACWEDSQLAGPGRMARPRAYGERVIPGQYPR